MCTKTKTKACLFQQLSLHIDDDDDCFKVAQESRHSGYPLLPNRDSYFRTHVQPRGSLNEYCSTPRGYLLSAQTHPI